MARKLHWLAACVGVCLNASVSLAMDSERGQREEALRASCGVPTYTADGKLTLGADVCESLYRTMEMMPDCIKEAQAGQIGKHYKSEEVQRMFHEESTEERRRAFARHETTKFWRTKDGSLFGALFPICGRERVLNVVHADMERQGKSYKPPPVSEEKK